MQVQSYLGLPAEKSYKSRAMHYSLIFMILPMYFGSSLAETCKNESCQSLCDSYCYGVVMPCMSNLANLQKRTEACESAVSIARLALNDKRLDPFGSPLTWSEEDATNGTLVNPRSMLQGDNSTFQKLGSKYYYIERTQKKNWHGALQQCHKLGGHLVNLQSQQELDAIKTKLKPSTRYWIDVTDQFQEGQYVSITNGSMTNFLNWDNNEPTNDGDCVDVILYNGKVVMNDNSCSTPLMFICETSAN